MATSVATKFSTKGGIDRMARSRIIMTLGIGVIALLTVLGVRQASIGAHKLASAQATVLHSPLRIDQVEEVIVMETTTICAHSSSTGIKLSRLVWIHHRKGSKLTRLAGMPANCRLYSAPPNPGWDRVTVTYPGMTFGSRAATTFTVLPEPPRP